MHVVTNTTPNNPEDLGEKATDLLFHALADATRRDILRRCGEGEASVSRLADAYPMSFAAVQKHVAVLEKAGLVTKVRRGREHLVHAEAEALARAKMALDHLELTWVARADRMSALLATTKVEPPFADVEGEQR